MTHLREVSGEAPLPHAGEALRAARERRGEDLGAVARALRIRKDHLQALEENRLEALPGRTYALGFVRSYAGYLGLDASASVEQFKHETAGRSEATPQVGFLDEPERLSLPYGSIFVTALVALIVIYGGYYLFRPSGAHRTATSVPAHVVLAHPRIALHHPLRAVARQAPVKAQAAPAAAAGAISGNLAASRPLPNLPAGQTFGMQNKNVRVVLHAAAATHLLVQGPGGKVYLNRILHPGDAYRVPNLVGLVLTAPNGGAVFLELDGQNMGLAGRPGQMTEALSLDPQAIVDRSNAGVERVKQNRVVP